jgi:WD40 repeat protein
LRARLGIFPILIIFAGIFVSPAVNAQRPCPLAPIPTVDPGANMFNSRQEMDLGDAFAEQFRRQFHVIDDPAVTAYLQHVGDRLVQHLSAGSIKYQFVLYDQPVANAFGTVGGRIYVSRKLVSFMRNDDELAGLLGHELGHLVAQQVAMEWTKLFKKVIGVNSVSDRRDIFDKYQLYVDNQAKQADVLRSIAREEEPNQIIADRLGLYAASVSGYDPRALVQFWDRFAETNGKTGNFFSDIFGTTKPEQKRLRELEAEMPSLPGPCGEARPPAAPAEFAAWRTAVMNYSGLGHRESLHGVVLRQELNPPLRGDINFLRFSPDGKYAFAQDDSSIYVLTHEPFAYVFRIDAPDAHPAVFSADSKNLSFYTRGLRVETWSLADQQRTDLHDMVILHGCVQTQLSPDGKYLACAEMLHSFHYDPQTLVVNGTIDLHVFDVSTGQAAFEKKDFSQPIVGILGRPFLIIESEDMRSRVMTMRFSPDGHYFLAASHNDDSVAVELPSLKPLSIGKSLKKYLNREFTFVGPDQLVGVGGGTTNASAVVRFPSGDVVTELTLGMQNIEAAAHGRYALLRPIDKFALGVMDLETKKIFMADANSAFDVYDSVALVTHANGEIGLKQVATKQDIASVLLPRGPLAPLRAEALSPDLKFLALSERSRGAVWDLTKNERPFYVRGFSGAYFTPDGTLYADFPKQQENARMIGQLDVNSHAQAPAYKVEENNAEQFGPYLLVRKPNGKDQNVRQNITLEVRDATSNAVLWTRPIPSEAPTISFSSLSGSAALMWRLSSASAASEIKANPDIAKRAELVPKDERNYLIEILNGHTGKLQGALVVDTNKGSFGPVSVIAEGDRVIISDSANRLEVYSLSSGQQTAKVFGRLALVSSSAGVLATENEAGQLLIYDLATMEKRDELLFNSTIAMKRFSDDGKRLFVLTAAQTAYVFEVAALSKPVTTSAGGGQ